ncbi:hypothetical protein HMSSN139_23670 [Paenibacillus sp. HMSSN-139]|nr:hypothetical protein HMSSN139_23670 [Paenibacillus sp. HMSSN-139]
MTGLFWWVVYPYIALTVLILGLLYRFAFRQASWAAPSTEIFEKNGCGSGRRCFITASFSLSSAM